MPPHFSRRTSWNRSPAGVAPDPHLPLLDLTVSNPTAAGFDFASLISLEPLAAPSARLYTPDPLGALPAREAIARYYAGHHATISPDHIVLTASTSESYSHLFRLLCDPGDEILIAQPSYPLFDYLADLADVQLRAFPLFFDHGWHIDRDALDRAVSPRTRALVVVHPNNPTGHITPAPERDHLRTFCARHSLPLIVDEVFLDYPLSPGHPIPTFAAHPATPLTFVLSGLSKIAALPQMKVGWIAALGAEAICVEAIARLELIADTFLSVSTPAQLALPLWLEQAPSVQRIIGDRLGCNLAHLAQNGIDVLPVDAGWSAILRLPRTYTEADAATALLQQGILTHAGTFFGMPETNRTVVSLLTPPETLLQAVKRLGSHQTTGPRA